MYVIILAGGLGTRLSEETDKIPKPLVEIGEKPIIWHIMKIYSYYGFNDFIICCGYKGYLIKEYFYNYFLHNSDFTINVCDNNMKIHNQLENWSITLVDTGLDSLTGTRLLRVKKHIPENETFLFTYGDGISSVNILDLIKFHYVNKKIATVIAIQPEGKFGNLQLQDNDVISFQEKVQDSQSWINGGFFVLDYKVFDYIPDYDVMFERLPLENITKDNQLNAYKHLGYWQCMDTLKDKMVLEEIWNKGNAPWKVW